MHDTVERVGPVTVQLHSDDIGNCQILVRQMLLNFRKQILADGIELPAKQRSGWVEPQQLCSIDTGVRYRELTLVQRQQRTVWLN